MEILSVYYATCLILAVVVVGIGVLLDFGFGVEVRQQVKIVDKKQYPNIVHDMYFPGIECPIYILYCSDERLPVRVGLSTFDRLSVGGMVEIVYRRGWLFGSRYAFRLAA